ncbi:MAG: DMT family transporter, partial [Spirochaetales bacterium]|nr:DMT family transporter [Spirochaetales bacterium]
VVLVAIVFSSLSAPLIRLSSAPPLAIAAWRMIFATALTVPLTAIEHGRRNREKSTGGVDASVEVRPRKVSPRLVVALITSGLFLAMHFATWISSLSFTSVVHSTVLVSMHPVLVTVAGAIVLREPIATRRLATLPTAIIGAIVLSAGGSVAGRSPTVLGDMLALAGAAGVAGYLVIGRWARRFVTVSTYSVTVYGVAAATLAVVARAWGAPLGPYPAREFVLFLALALLCTILGHSLMNWALRHLDAAEVSTYILLEPVFATVIVALFLGEIPGIVSVAGAALVLVSLTFAIPRGGDGAT